MASVESLRQVVAARAGGACEYCRLVQDASGVTFHVEHVLPQSLGGETSLANLALSCPGCNLAKSACVHATDAEGVLRPIFNPRAFEPSILGWHLHFVLDRRSGLVLPRSKTGEASVQQLKINDPRRAFARKLQIEAGLIG